MRDKKINVYVVCMSQDIGHAIPMKWEININVLYFKQQEEV